MNHFGADPRRERNEEEQQQAVVGASALRDRYDGQPVELFLARQARPGHGVDHRCERVDEITRQDACQQAKRGEREHRRQRPAVGLHCLARNLRARPAEKRDAERLDEARRRERCREREQCADRGNQELEQPLRQGRAKEDGLEREPFGDEAVERRQRRDRGRADQKGEGRERHAMDQPAEALHVALAGAREHRAGAEEQQALEHRVIEDVEEGRSQRERRRGRHLVRLEGERQAKADEDDADVLHRVIGEQALEVVLHQGVQHAHHRGHAAYQRHHGTPPPARRPEQVEHDAHESIDRDLGHDAAHQRRDMARRRRVGERQPDVQRHETGLGTGADQREHQDHGGYLCRRRRLANGLERIASRRPGEQAEAEHQRERSQARHDEIEVTCEGVARPAVMRHHQGP